MLLFCSYILNFDFLVYFFRSVTKNYFENLVRALENGLSDVDANGASFSKATSSKNAAGSSKGRAGRGKGALRTNRTSDDTHWSCEHCTSVNVKSATTCQICNQRRWKCGFSVRNTCYGAWPLHQRLRLGSSHYMLAPICEDNEGNDIKLHKNYPPCTQLNLLFIFCYRLL